MPSWTVCTVCTGVQVYRCTVYRPDCRTLHPSLRRLQADWSLRWGTSCVSEKNEKIKFLITNKNDLPASTGFSLRKHTHSPLTLTIFDLKGEMLRNENEIWVARGKRFQKICKKYSILKRPVYGTTINRSAAINFWLIPKTSISSCITRPGGGRSKTKSPNKT